MRVTKYLGEQIFFHATNVDAAVSIMDSKQFRPGRSGLFGAGIYFADSIYYCFRKSANGTDAVIMCRVNAGTALVIEGSSPQMNINYLKQINCQSVQGRYQSSSGWEYIVYEQDRVTPLNAIMPPNISQIQNTSLARSHNLANNGNIIFHFSVVPNLPFQIILNSTTFTQIRGPNLTNNPLLSAAYNFSSHIFTDSITLNNYTALNVFSNIANNNYLKFNHFTHKELLNNPLFQSNVPQLMKNLDFKYSTDIAMWTIKELSKKIKSAFLLSLIGAINSCLVAEYLTNKNEILKKLAAQQKIGAGIMGPGPIGGLIGGLGGVEFRTIKKMLEFTNEVLVMASKNNIFFESKFEKEIRDAFSLICLDQYHNMPISYYFETIVREIQIGFLGGESIPFISLHFNKQGHLYSVMDNYYRNTIIGNVITFLDYFLKGFVNGGYFTIPFVQGWEKNPVDDMEHLNRNLVDIHGIAKEKNLDYKSIYDLINADETIDKFSSAFRIIGELNEKVYFSENTFNPTSDFSVENDVNQTADFANSILQDLPNVQCEWNTIISAHHIMKEIIHRIMPEIPYFKGFFEILKMITFALYYVASFHAIGQFIKTPNALQSKSRGPYVHPIPNIFPPLPVRHITKINLKIKVEDIVDLLNSTQIDSAFRILTETNKNDVCKPEYQTIMNTLSSFYHKKIEDGLPKPIIHFPDDNIINLKDFKDKAINAIKVLYLKKKEMEQFIDILNDQYIKIFPTIFPHLQNQNNVQNDDLSYNAYSDLSNQFDQYRKLIKTKFDEMAINIMLNSQLTNNTDQGDEKIKGNKNIMKDGQTSQTQNIKFEDTQLYQILSTKIAESNQAIQTIKNVLSQKNDVIKQVDSLGANNHPQNYEIKKQCEQEKAIFEIILADLNNEDQICKDELVFKKNEFDSMQKIKNSLDDNGEAHIMKQELLHYKNELSIINKVLQNKIDIIQRINALPMEIQQISLCSGLKAQYEQIKIINEFKLMNLNNIIHGIQNQLDLNQKYYDFIQNIDKESENQRKSTKNYNFLDDKEITQQYNHKKQIINEKISYYQKNIEIVQNGLLEKTQIIQKLHLLQSEIQQNPIYKFIESM